MFYIRYLLLIVECIFMYYIRYLLLIVECIYMYYIRYLIYHNYEQVLVVINYRYNLNTVGFLCTTRGLLSLVSAIVFFILFSTSIFFSSHYCFIDVIPFYVISFRSLCFYLPTGIGKNTE